MSTRHSRQSGLAFSTHSRLHPTAQLLWRDEAVIRDHGCVGRDPRHRTSTPLGRHQCILALLLSRRSRLHRVSESLSSPTPLRSVWSRSRIQPATPRIDITTITLLCLLLSLTSLTNTVTLPPTTLQHRPIKAPHLRHSTPAGHIQLSLRVHSSASRPHHPSRQYSSLRRTPTRSLSSFALMQEALAEKAWSRARVAQEVAVDESTAATPPRLISARPAWPSIESPADNFRPHTSSSSFSIHTTQHFTHRNGLLAIAPLAMPSARQRLCTPQRPGRP